MPVYEVEDPQGRTLEIEGDHVPTAEELTNIFTQAFPAPAQAAPEQPAPQRPALVRAPLPTMGPQGQQMLQTGMEQLSKPLVNIPAELTTPPLTQLVPSDTIQKAGQAVGGEAAQALSSLTSPLGLATIPAMMVLPEVVGPGMAASMAPQVAEGAKETWKGITSADIPETMRGLTKGTIALAGVAGGLIAPFHGRLLPKAAKEVVSPSEEPVLETPTPAAEPVAAPPKIAAVEQQARRAEIKAARPEVPETPPEPERGLTVIQEIREKGANTRRKVQELFPSLSNETAAKLRDQAFPRVKVPDNLSRTEIDRLFLDKLNKESNEEIANAIPKRETEEVPVAVPPGDSPEVVAQVREQTPTQAPKETEVVPERSEAATEMVEQVAREREKQLIQNRLKELGISEEQMREKSTPQLEEQLKLIEAMNKPKGVPPLPAAAKQRLLNKVSEIKEGREALEGMGLAKPETPANKPIFRWLPTIGGKGLGKLYRAETNAKGEPIGNWKQVGTEHSLNQARTVVEQAKGDLIEGVVNPEVEAKPPPLSIAERSEVQAELSQALGEETGPGIVDLGAATPASIPKAPSRLKHWWDVNFGKPASHIIPTARSLWQGRAVRANMAVMKDWVDNQAKVFARSTANDIRQPLRRLFKNESEVADNALSMVVEAKDNPQALDQMRIKLLDSQKADPWWRRKALDALDYASYHWDQLSKLAQDYRKITESQVDLENASGIDTLRLEGYVPHRQDFSDVNFLSNIGHGDSTFFRKIREHPTFADSIAAGVDPVTMKATDLLENRLSSGMRLVNNRQWLEQLRTWTDPKSKQPIAQNLIKRTRADGSSYMEAPEGYVKESVGPHDVAILKGYEGTFSALTDPSAFTKSMVGRGFMEANATGKSINLMIDTFHLGRLAFWDSLIKGLGIRTFKMPFPSYKRGLTMMDFTESQIREMAANGEVPKEWLPRMLENKRQLDLAIKTGYNVGRISDALYQDLIHSMPVVGKFNKWLFDQFQRGAMAESWLLEFDRAKLASPGVPEEQLARQVSHDLNIRFGNLGRQGIFKSKTSQDAARSLFLAPQWNEGLIRSEIGAIKQAGEFAIDAMTGKRIYSGVLLRSVGAMALMQFVANQIINQATRGTFTWENPEEGWGAKLSAWIPDVAGNGPGFFLHPLGLAAETTHLLTNLYERSGGDTTKVALDYLRSRSSAAMRPVLTWLTRTDFLGRHIKPDTLWGEIVKSAIPLPIAGKAVGAMGQQIVTGQPSEQFAGQYQKQAMSSFGVRTESAPSPEQRISRLAAEWRREKGVEPNLAFMGTGVFQPLVQAVHIGNMKTANAELAKLRENHTDDQIQKHFRQWVKAPFTGSHAREREFMKGLSAEQEVTYLRARDNRERIASEVRKLLR